MVNGLIAVSKIIFIGRKGSGKSTIIAFLAKGLSKRGYKVLVITPNIDQTLYRMLGFTSPAIPLLEVLGGLDKIRFDKPEDVSKLDLDFIKNLKGPWIKWRRNIGLLTVSRASSMEERLLEVLYIVICEILRRLKTGSKDIILISGGSKLRKENPILRYIDYIIMIIDPSYESLTLARKISKEVKSLGKRFFYIANKCEKELLDLLIDEMPEGILLGSVGYHRKIIIADIRSEKLSKVDVEEIEDIINNMIRYNIIT